MKLQLSKLVVVVAAALVPSSNAWRAANRSLASSPSEQAITGNKPTSIGVGCTSGVSYPGHHTPRFTATVEDANAEFLTVHFSKFNLPPDDYLLVRPTRADDSEKLSFKYYGREHSGAFFSNALYTKSITIELVTSGDTSGNNVFQCPGFAIDNYRFVAQPAMGSKKEEVCGTDDSAEAACFRGYPDAFKRSDAVLRLLIHKGESSFFCTGWLVGCEGHMLTNHHCISTQDHASNTEFEFRAQGDTCSTSCSTPLGCKGSVRARSAQLVMANPDLDYALVKLDINFSNDYGYLQMREGGAVLGERIYVPQHAGGWGKRIAMKNGDQWGTVESTSQGGCLPNQVAYSLDTQGGSSGSPVLAWADNAVVAIHHCGGCPNTAVNTNQLVADMRTKGILPNCAVYAAPTPAPVPSPTMPPTGRPTTSPPSTNPPTAAPAPTTTAPPPSTTAPPPTTTAPPPTTTAPPPTTTAPPPITTAPPTAAPRRSTTVDGTITTTATVASIDYIDFVLASEAVVEIDILSMEATTADGAYVDVNNDCNAGYIDSSIVLFQVNGDGSVSEATTIALNDDAPTGYGRADGSISAADSYIVRPLAAGRYRVAVGASSMTLAQAIAKSMPLATSPRVCDGTISNYGSYRLTLRTTSDVSVTSPNSYIGSQCSGDNTVRPYAKCPYHTEAALSKTVALDGTIVRLSGSVSVDHIPFTVPAFGRVTMDLSSYENDDQFAFVDVNGFCTSGYIDAVAYLFRRSSPVAALTAADLVNAVDDDDNFGLRSRAGVSFRDPFLSLALPVGNYVLVVGRYPMTVQGAITKVNTALPDIMTPESCGNKASQGNYRVTFASARDLAAVAPGSFSGSKCPANAGNRLCKSS